MSCCPARRLCARLLPLYHTCTAGNQILIFQHFEEYLAGDIIRIVSRQHKKVARQTTLQVHFEEVVLKCCLPVADRLPVGRPLTS